MARRCNLMSMHGIVFVLFSPLVALAGDFDLSERRLMAGVREYHSGVFDSIAKLAGDIDLLRRTAANPEVAAMDNTLDSGTQAGLRELAAYPGLLSIIADSPERVSKLTELMERSRERFFERLDRLRMEYDAYARASSGAWQQLLDQDSAALGEYRSLLNDYCEAQRQRFADFPFVVVKSRAYYLACPPDETLLAFAAQRGVGDSLGRVFDRWAADFSPAAIDAAVLENGETVRSPREDDLLAYLPPERRADMWSLPGAGESELIGLMPVIMQPRGDQPEEAKRAKRAAETARLWSPPVPTNRETRTVPRDDIAYGTESGRLPIGEDDYLDGNAPEIAGDALPSTDSLDDREVSALQSNPWTPYTELTPDNYGDDDAGYESRSYASSNRGYYDDGWYGGTYIDVGPTVYYGRTRYYSSYSCGVPSYYGCAPIAACPPVVVWQHDRPLFCRERSRGGISISIGGSDGDRWRDHDRVNRFPQRRWEGEPATFGRGRDISERSNLESSRDSLRRRPSSVTQVPIRPREPNAAERIRSARENLNDRLAELRDRAGRNTREIGRRAGANAPAGQPASPHHGGATIRRSPTAPAGSPAAQPGNSPRRLGPAAPAGQPAAPRGSAVRSSRPTDNSPAPRSSSRPPIKRTPRPLPTGQQP